MLDNNVFLDLFVNDYVGEGIIVDVTVTINGDLRYGGMGAFRVTTQVDGLQNPDDDLKRALVLLWNEV